MDPQTIDLDHGRPLFDPPEKHALGLLKRLELVSGLKPSRSRSGLGTTMWPALSILTSIPLIIDAIDNGGTGTRIRCRMPACWAMVKGRSSSHLCYK
jgi:hypothetical protein